MFHDDFQIDFVFFSIVTISIYSRKNEILFFRLKKFAGFIREINYKEPAGQANYTSEGAFDDEDP